MARLCEILLALSPWLTGSPSYVCSKNVLEYSHFGDAQNGSNKCPLYDNVEDRHEQEVKKAAEDAMANVRAEHPGLSDADLMIKVSDGVKRAEHARRDRAELETSAFPYRVVGGQLQNRRHAAPHHLPLPPIYELMHRRQPLLARPDVQPPPHLYVPPHPFILPPVQPHPFASAPAASLWRRTAMFTLLPSSRP